jgi:uncharacterized membrane protein YeaQ/YmgE (transglycosylase-associated protein family)
MNLIIAVIVGGLAGWMAGKLTKGEGYGVFFNILLGIVGGYLFKWLDISTANNFVGSLVTALIGSIALLIIAKMAK